LLPQITRGLSLARLGTALLAVSGCSAHRPLSTAVDPGHASAQNLPQAPSDRLAGLSVGLAYSGYRTGQHPDRGSGAVEPSEAEILEDLKLLTRDGEFGLIRLYDTGDLATRVLKIIRAHDLPLRVMQGAWLEGEVDNHEDCAWVTEPVPQSKLVENRARNIKEVDRLINLAKAYPKIIVAVNVGNEVLVTWNDHLVPIESMRAHLSRVKAAVAQPVTVADNYVAWAEHGPALRDVVDFVAVHTYPAWEQKSIEQAMPYTVANIRQVQAALPGMPLVIGEAGWPSVASEFGQRASEANQQLYYELLTAWAARNNITTFVFEAFDEDWKGNPNNPLGAEKHWGLFNIDRTPKQVMHSRYPDLVAPR